jgi:hypothetical protein
MLSGYATCNTNPVRERRRAARLPHSCRRGLIRQQLHRSETAISSKDGGFVLCSPLGCQGAEPVCHKLCAFLVVLPQLLPNKMQNGKMGVRRQVREAGCMSAAALEPGHATGLAVAQIELAQLGGMP